jgi:uncharacterized protein YcbK (DUF882 family)
VTAHFFAHYRDIPPGFWRWTGFSPAEIACRHCGEIVVDTGFMDALQRQREDGHSIVLNSAYRCPAWNAMAGGAPLSQHKFGRAGDQRLSGRPIDVVQAAAKKAGFGGFGRYRTFLHADTGPQRTWASSSS